MFIALMLYISAKTHIVNICKNLLIPNNFLSQLLYCQIYVLLGLFINQKGFGCQFAWQYTICLVFMNMHCTLVTLCVCVYVCV